MVSLGFRSMNNITENIRKALEAVADEKTRLVSAMLSKDAA